jgi:hypothetical protein
MTEVRERAGTIRPGELLEGDGIVSGRRVQPSDGARSALIPERKFLSLPLGRLSGQEVLPPTLHIGTHFDVGDIRITR